VGNVCWPLHFHALTMSTLRQCCPCPASVLVPVVVGFAAAIGRDPAAVCVDSGARVVGALLEVLGAHRGVVPAREAAGDVLEAALQLAAVGKQAMGLGGSWLRGSKVQRGAGLQPTSCPDCIAVLACLRSGIRRQSLALVVCTLQCSQQARWDDRVCLQRPPVLAAAPSMCMLLAHLSFLAAIAASGGLYTRVGAVFVPVRVAAEVLGAHLGPTHVERLLRLCCKAAAVMAPDAWQVRPSKQRLKQGAGGWHGAFRVQHCVLCSQGCQVVAFSAIAG
jgi:hypothetical protein